MSKKELLSLSLLESKISIILRFLKFIFWLSVVMNFVSLLFIFFSATKYYDHFDNTSFLDVVQALSIYAAFYVLIFAAFPAAIILILLYFLFKLKLKKRVQITNHFALIILNLLILIAIFLVVAINKP